MTTDKETEKLLHELEAISINFPNRIVRLKGKRKDLEGGYEKVEILVYRGFSSCTTHPTRYDPSLPSIPKGTHLIGGEILKGPMNPSEEISLTKLCQPKELLNKRLWES